METCNTMQKVIEDLCKKHGEDPRDPDLFLKIKNPPYQPLIIEAVGPNMIALQHYVRDSWGDLVSDPDMVFYWARGMDMRTFEDRWFIVPVSLQMSSGHYFLASKIEGGDIKQYIPAEQKRQKSFATMWAKNIRDQGFISEGVRVDKYADPASPEL